MSSIDDDAVPAGYAVIYCTSYFNKKAGRRIYASQYGLTAFRFVVKAK